MKFKLHFLILASLTASKIDGTTAKKCWECVQKFELGGKVPKCEEIKEATCPNEYFMCLSVTGADKEGNSINFKKCIEQDKNSCEKLSNANNITSCTICDSELCNDDKGLMCYSCDKSHKCSVTKCFDKSFSCFSAQNLKNESLEKVKGCISNTEIFSVQKKYEEKGISFSVCDRSDLCNNKARIARSERPHICYAIGSNSLVREECPNSQKIEYSCFTVRGFENKQFVVLKGCVPKNETASKCKEYEAKGLSCSTCDSSACNKESVDKCYHCEDDCEKQVKRDCLVDIRDLRNIDEYSCLSLEGVNKDGKPYYYKGCVQSFKMDSKFYEIERGGVTILSREACYKDNCNKPGPKCYKCDEDSEFCNAKEVTCFSENFGCFMAEDRQKRKIKKLKSCMDKTVFSMIQLDNTTCKSFNEKQVSCAICSEDLCNKKRSGAIRKCFDCALTDFGCSPKVKTCPDYDDFSCLAAAYTMRNTNLPMKRRYCVLKYSGNAECEKLRKDTKRFACTVCNSNLCNKDTPKPKKSRSNVLTISLKTFLTIFFLTLL